jgi:transketolase
MDPNLKTDPEHIGLLWGLLGILGGLLIAAGKKMLGRHEIENDDLLKQFREHIAESSAHFGALGTRLTVLEDRKLVTLPELELAIEKALTTAVKLFSPEHQAIAKQMNEGLRDAEKKTAELVSECNNKVRNDFRNDLNEVKSEVAAIKEHIVGLRAENIVTQNMLGEMTRILAGRKEVREKSRK